MVAPFWADADTRKGDGGIYFRETSDICQIDRATEEIRSFTGDSTFRPSVLLVATYNKVGYTQMKTDKVCASLSFILIIVHGYQFRYYIIHIKFLSHLYSNLNANYVIFIPIYVHNLWF